MKRIGKGLFSTVFLDGDTVIVKSVCRAKECNALFGYGDSDLWPEIERIDYDDISTYRMPFYERPKSLKKALDPDQWEIYRILRNFKPEVRQWLNCYEKAIAQVRAQNPELADALQDAVDNLANYGSDMMFEISPRNVAVKDGKLILLDVWFFSSQAKEQRTQRKYAY